MTVFEWFSCFSLLPLAGRMWYLSDHCRVICPFFIVVVCSFSITSGWVTNLKCKCVCVHVCMLAPRRMLALANAFSLLSFTCKLGSCALHGGVVVYTLGDRFHHRLHMNGGWDSSVTAEGNRKGKEWEDNAKGRQRKRKGMKGNRKGNKGNSNGR